MESENKNVRLKKDYMYQIIQCVLCMYTQVKIRKSHEELNCGQMILSIIFYIKLLIVE